MAYPLEKHQNLPFPLTKNSLLKVKRYLHCWMSASFITNCCMYNRGIWLKSKTPYTMLSINHKPTKTPFLQTPRITKCLPSGSTPHRKDQERTCASALPSSMIVLRGFELSTPEFARCYVIYTHANPGNHERLTIRLWLVSQRSRKIVSVCLLMVVFRVAEDLVRGFGASSISQIRMHAS